MYDVLKNTVRVVSIAVECRRALSEQVLFGTVREFIIILLTSSRRVARWPARGVPPDGNICLMERASHLLRVNFRSEGVVMLRVQVQSFF